VRHFAFNELTRARPSGVSHRARDQLKRPRVNERREIHSPRFELKFNSGRKTSLNSARGRDGARDGTLENFDASYTQLG